MVFTLLICIKINFIIASNCSVLTCGSNQVCENVDGIFQCVCLADYSGSDCSEFRKYFFSLRCVSDKERLHADFSYISILGHKFRF